MIVLTEKGPVEVRPGQPLCGIIIGAVTITAKDVAHPDFMPWFEQVVLMRFGPPK